MNTRILCCVLGLTMMASMTGCGPSYVAETQRSEMELTERVQKVLLKAVPTPEPTDSLERRNLVRRLNLFMDADKIGYIYLIDFGKVMAHYTVKGKLSSTESLLTTPNQLVTGLWGKHNYETLVVESPDLDGSYGQREKGIFFFCTDGAYVQTDLKHLYFDRPMTITTPVTLVADVSEDVR